MLFLFIAVGSEERPEENGQSDIKAADSHGSNNNSDAEDKVDDRSKEIVTMPTLEALEPASTNG